MEQQRVAPSPAVRLALAAAEASGGGTIRFMCGNLPTTILFNEIDGGAVLVLPGGTIINDGGLSVRRHREPSRVPSIRAEQH